MPGRHSGSSDDHEAQPLLGDSRFIAVFALLVVVAAGLAVYFSLDDGGSSGQGSDGGAPAAVLTVGAHGECLGSYLFVPTATANRTARGDVATSLDLRVENRGVDCRLSLPVEATTATPSGSTGVVKFVVKSSLPFEFAAGGHIDLKIENDLTRDKGCARATADISSITLEFGGQNLRVAVPANFKPVLWTSACSASNAATSINLSR